MSREAQVRFWESAAVRSAAPLDCFVKRGQKVSFAWRTGGCT
jgi:hypothetical protein